MISTLQIKTFFNLGLVNIFRIIKYRLSTKFSLNSLYNIEAQLPSGHFFSQDKNILIKGLSENVEMTAFGFHKYNINKKYPDWMFNPLTNTVFDKKNVKWFEISDFDSNVGDIKGIWEASRFDWLIDLILKERQKLNGESIAILDAWLNDWCQHNQAYIGPNWKCGQEASIRIMHLITALIGLNQFYKPNENVLKLIEIHLKRIAPTIDYAIAQDNNHGTSEAVALFIGGSLLNALQPNSQNDAWSIMGHKWLENRAAKLIMQDGGFSQYSVNYHRVMLDSYCLAEILRQKLSLPKFSKRLYTQIGKATDWLYILTQENGDAPNLGANDGAKLLPVCATDYRDFRPTVQLASTLFCQHSYYAELGNYDETLDFFGINKVQQPDFNLPNKNVLFDSSGLITAENSSFFTAFKLPIFKFRPSQSDALHLDVWCKGENILRDGGTYSYNSSAEELEYFSGTESHNTVQFDQHLQMPRLSRFLFGAWLKPENLNYQKDQFSCGYQDNWGCKHRRNIVLKNKNILVTDHVSGFKDQAVLRWRLQPGKWELNGKKICNSAISLEIETDNEAEISLSLGYESRYYYQKTVLPVLEVKVKQSSTIITVIKDLS